MNKLDKQYTDLLQDILDNGVEKETRNGKTLSVFGRSIRHDMKDGFSLLTTKKMSFKTIVTELLWFLRGDTNIKYLVDNNCHIWNGDAYKRYLVHTISGVNNGFDKIKGYLDNCLVEFNGEYEHFNNPSFQYGYRPHTQEEFIDKIKNDKEFSYRFGNLGPIYGKQWRSWKNPTFPKISKEFSDICDGRTHIEVDCPIDQITELITQLKENPDSRRLMVNAWAVHDLPNMVIPPCHYGFQVYTRELSISELNILYNKRRGVGEIDTKYTIGTITAKDPNIPRRAISLMWNQRSVDTFLGLPFNIASYGLLLEMVAKEVNMVPSELIGNLGDVHLYLDHLEQAKEQIGRDLTDEERYNIWFNNNYETGMERFFDPNNLPDFENAYYTPTPKRTREPFELPKLGYVWFVENWTTEEAKKARSDSFDSYIRNLRITDFIVNGYKSHPAIKAHLSN